MKNCFKMVKLALENRFQAFPSLWRFQKKLFCGNFKVPIERWANEISREKL
jgi:hypothetical protein